MTILEQVPGSVLWLLTGTDETNSRLQQMAEQRGIRRDRLVFAEKKPNPEHLARYPLADMFLDTFPYGAHTTAADAMWMGVPMLTVPGRSFASRVCASLVRAAGMGDLVCATAEAYVARAIELGRNPDLVAALKRRLIAARDTCAAVRHSPARPPPGGPVSPDVGGLQTRVVAVSEPDQYGHLLRYRSRAQSRGAWKP